MPHQPSITTTTVNRSRTSTNYNAASSSTVKPLSATESYEWKIEKILDQQDNRLQSVKKEIGILNLENKDAFNFYKSLNKDTIDEENKYIKAAEKLISSLKIVLIRDFESKKTIEKATQENIKTRKTDNDKKISSRSNTMLLQRENSTRIYLQGRIPALESVVALKNTRLSPKELFEKINQAAIETEFYRLELLITEKDVKKKLNQDEKQEQFRQMILLSIAKKFYHLKFLNWYENNNEKIEQLLKCKENEIDDIPSLQEKILSLEEQISNIQECLNEKYEESYDQYLFIQWLEEQKSNLEGQVNYLTNEVKMLKKALDQEKKDRLKTENLLKDDIEQKKTTIISLEEELKHKTEINNLNTKEKEELAKKIEGLKEQIISLESDLNAKNKDLNQQQTIVEALKQEKISLEKKLKHKTETNDLNTKEKEELAKKIEGLEDRIIKLEGNLNAKNEDLNEKQKIIESLKEGKSQLQEENKLLMQQAEALHKKLNEEKTSASDIKVMLESFINGFESFIHNNNLSKENVNQDLKRQYEQYQSQLEELKNQLKSILEIDFQKKDSEIKQTREHLKSLMMHIIKNTQVSQQLTDKFESLQQKNEETNPSRKNKNTITINITTTTITKTKQPIVLSNLFNEIICPVFALQDLKKLHDCTVNSSNPRDVREPLKKLFLEINRSTLLKECPQAMAELTKISIYMVYSLVQDRKILPSDGVDLLLSIRPSIGTFIDRAPLVLYLSTLAYLIQFEPNPEVKNSQIINIRKKFSEKKEGIDLYKIIKQWIKSNYMDKYKKKPINLPKDLAQALIQFKQAGLIPNSRQLYQFIDINQENSKFNIFPENFCITEEDLNNVARLKEIDIINESSVERSNFFRRSILRKGSVKINRPSKENSHQTSIDRSGTKKIVDLKTNTSGFYSQAQTKEHDSPELGEKSGAQLTK